MAEISENVTIEVGRGKIEIEECACNTTITLRNVVLTQAALAALVWVCTNSPTVSVYFS